MGIGGIAPQNSALSRNERSASRTGRCIPGARAAVKKGARNRMFPEKVRKLWRKKNPLLLSRIEIQYLGRPVFSTIPSALSGLVDVGTSAFDNDFRSFQFCNK
jgi:hypothetical protein